MRSVLFLVWDFINKTGSKISSKASLLELFSFSLVVVLLLVTGTGSLKLGQLNLQSLIFVLAIIPFWILQGGTEELVTRGWLFPAVSAKSNIFIGILISSALFGHCTSLTLV